MALKRWEPLGELEQMRRQMDRMFGSVFGRGLPGLPGLERATTFMPNVEVYETDQDVVVNAELPGMDPKDVSVEITEDSIRLTGELSSSQEIKEDNYFRSERSYGHFERLVPLPNRIKDDEARATFKHGVLTVRAPLAEQVKRTRPHKIEIRTE
jgi:HSP20 family protein